MDGQAFLCGLQRALLVGKWPMLLGWAAAEFPWGAYQALWVFGSQVEMLAPSPLSHPHCPRLPGDWYGELAVMISRKRMGPRDTWRRKASGKAGSEMLVLGVWPRVPAERPHVVLSQE